MLETHSPSPYPYFHQQISEIRFYIPHEMYSIFEYSEARRLFLSSGKKIKSVAVMNNCDMRVKLNKHYIDSLPVVWMLAYLQFEFSHLHC